jgi:flagellar basal body rod protein FlgB
MPFLVVRVLCTVLAHHCISGLQYRFEHALANIANKNLPEYNEKRRVQFNSK